MEASKPQFQAFILSLRILSKSNVVSQTTFDLIEQFSLLYLVDLCGQEIFCETRKNIKKKITSNSIALINNKAIYDLFSNLV